MAARGHRRQILLFLVAIILPCVVLVALGLRMVAQEQELAERRLADQRRGIAGQVRQELAVRLDRTALQEATALGAQPGRLTSRTYMSPAVALVARAVDGHLALPWEHDPRPARFRRLLGRSEFAWFIRQGERAEIGERQPSEAASSYGAALAVAVDPAQAAYARLLRGRAGLAAGRRAAALQDLEAVLRTSLEVVDEHGIPLALYAAARLLAAGAQRVSVVDRVRRAVADSAWLSPTALYLLRDLAVSLRSSADSTAAAAARDLTDAVFARVATTQQAIALQEDFPRLGLDAARSRGDNAETRWIPYGTPLWLVGRAAPVAGGGEVILAVRADSVLAAAVDAVRSSSSSGSAEIVVAPDQQDAGEALGVAFPGLTVRFTALPDTGYTGWDARRWFYGVALLLVLSITIFGAYLVSRDVRRELRLAETRSRFVSAVSHELKTPLTAIRMYAETLQLGRSPDPERQTEYLETIVQESERLTRLLNNVLDFSKIERGLKEYRLAPNDLADIVGASARAMRYQLEQQHFTLHLEVQEGIPPVKVDRDAIEQAILNLLSNAMKYSGASRVIDLRLEQANGAAVITVADRGVGIAAGEQARIFEQFYRVPAKENDGVPGTGLGLTLVRHIAEGHGGSVTVTSAPGAGSAFAVHLPLGAGAP